MASEALDIIIELDNRVHWDPEIVTCPRCGDSFHKKNKNKVYCTPACQDPGRYRMPNLEHAKRTNRELAELETQASLAQLMKVFERATGIPYVYQMPAASRSHRPKADLFEPGWVWIDGHNEPDPVEIETRLRSRDPGQLAGETPDEWKARGNVVRVLPSGKAFII